LLSRPVILDRVLRAARAIAAATALSLLAGACGSSPGSHVAQLGTTTASQTGAVAYARCVRAHGVPHWPDPSASGTFDKSKLTAQRLGASSSRVDAAERSCRHLLTNGGQPTRAASQRIKAQALHFSQCVRSHGVPSFPDPGSDGRIPDPASAGIDQGSPKFQAANIACAAYRPPYVPSNAAYDDWARTHTNG